MTKNHGKRWTKKEEDAIITSRKQLSFSKIAKRIGRTTGATRIRFFKALYERSFITKKITIDGLCKIYPDITQESFIINFKQQQTFAKRAKKRKKMPVSLGDINVEFVGLKAEVHELRKILERIELRLNNSERI